MRGSSSGCTGAGDWVMCLGVSSIRLVRVAVPVYRACPLGPVGRCVGIHSKTTTKFYSGIAGALWLDGNQYLTLGCYPDRITSHGMPTMLRNPTETATLPQSDEAE